MSFITTSFMLSQDEEDIGKAKNTLVTLSRYMNCWLICREEINRKIYGFTGKKGVSMSGTPFIFTQRKNAQG